MFRSNSETWAALRGCSSGIEFAERLRTLLAQHPFQPEDRLPAIRVLTGITGLSANEVYRGLQRLTTEGWVVQRRGSGTFVGGRKAQVDERAPLPDSHIRRIGVIPPGWDPHASHEAVGATFQAIAVDAARRGYRVEIVASDPEEYTRLSFADRILSLGLDGVIWIQPSYDFPLALLRLMEASIPTVLTSRGFQGVDAPVVAMDFMSLGELVAEYMEAHGRTRLVALVGCRDDYYTQQHVGSLRQALEKRGLTLPDERLLTTRVGHKRRFYSFNAERAFEDFFAANADFDSVFSLYPDSLELLFAMHHAGKKRCPDDYLHAHFIRSTLSPQLAWQEMPIAFIEPPSALVGMRAVQELERLWGAEPAEPAPPPKPILHIDPRMERLRAQAV